MKKVERDELAKRVVRFYVDCANKDKTRTWLHFKSERYQHTTISRIIKRYEETGAVTTKSPPGRTPRSDQRKVFEAIENTYQSDPSISEREAAARHGVSPSWLHEIKVQKLGFKSYRKETTPRYKKNQEKTAKTNCRKIYRNRVLGEKPKIIIMDDETYVPVDAKNISGRQFYTCRNKSEVPDKDRFEGKEKFYEKFLVWQAIDESGNVSVPFVTKSTMNWEIYLNKCFKKRLPFIKKHHNLNDVLVWMDMATCHYKKEVTDWLSLIGLDFISKNENAPNVPQARPIEKFWAICKAKYKKNNEKAEDIKNFRVIWRRISYKVGKDSAQKLMLGARRNLRLIAYQGVLAPYKSNN